MYIIYLTFANDVHFSNNLQADSIGSLEAYHQAINYERRAKHPDIFVTRGIYERALTEAAKRQFSGETGAHQALKMFWSSYCDALVSCLPVATDIPHTIPRDFWTLEPTRSRKFIEEL